MILKPCDALERLIGPRRKDDRRSITEKHKENLHAAIKGGTIPLFQQLGQDCYLVRVNKYAFSVMPDLIPAYRQAGGIQRPLKRLDSGHSTKLMALSIPKGFRRNEVVL
jgi:hypothetical protein